MNKNKVKKNIFFLRYTGYTFFRKHYIYEFKQGFIKYSNKRYCFNAKNLSRLYGRFYHPFF